MPQGLVAHPVSIAVSELTIKATRERGLSAVRHRRLCASESEMVAPRRFAALSTHRLAVRRALSTLARPELRGAHVDGASGLVQLQWSDGRERKLHPLWLRDNCPSRRHPGTGQKLHSAADLPDGLAVSRSEATGGALRISWEPDGHSSEFCAQWLHAVAPVDGAAPQPQAAATPSSTIPVFEYDDACRGGDAARHRWMRGIFECGATLLRGVPCTEEAVREVAERLGPIQPQIYGEIFDVRSEPGAINLAYTTEAIGPHMDLCYYESPPGAANPDPAVPHTQPDPHPSGLCDCEGPPEARTTGVRVPCSSGAVAALTPTSSHARVARRGVGRRTVFGSESRGVRRAFAINRPR